MAETLTSYVVTLGSDAADEAPAYALFVEPSEPAPGEPYTLVALAPYAVSMASPYPGDPLTAGTGAADDIEDTVSLGGQDSISPAKPIATLLTAVAVTPLVDADNAVIVPAGASALNRLSVPLGRLEPDQPLWGSVRLSYRTHPAQRWTSAGQPAAGEYVYRATADAWDEPERLAVNVGESGAGGSAYKITVEPANPTVGQSFRIRIASPLDFSLASPYGERPNKTLEAAEAVSETVALGGNASVNASQPLAALATAVAATPLVNAAGKIIAAAGADLLRQVQGTDDGALALPEPLWGSLAITGRSYPWQTWTLPGYSRAGQYVFTALAAGIDPEPVTVDVGKISNSYSWGEADDGDSGAKFVYLYIRPWRASVDLQNSAGGQASIVYQGIEEAVVEDTVEIVNGAGSLSKPYYGTVAAEWRYNNLGILSISAEGAIVTGPGQTLLHLQYRTRRHKWRVTATVPEVQVWPEE